MSEIINIACVDLDGVLYVYKKHSGVTDFSRSPNPEALKLLIMLKNEGWKITIYSSRLNGTWDTPYEEIRLKVIDWLEKHSVPYDDIARPEEGKRFATVYIDDRSVWFPTNKINEGTAEEIYDKIKEVSSGYDPHDTTLVMKKMGMISKTSEFLTKVDNDD